MTNPHRKCGVCINAPELVSVAVEGSPCLGPESVWLVGDDFTDKPVVFAISI